MDKYEELKNEVLKRTLEYQQELELIKGQINNTSCEDLVRLLDLSDEFRACLYDIQAANRKYARLIDDEKKIRQMIESFYEADTVVISLVYRSIYKMPLGYYVREEHFSTLDEAIEYSISLGEIPDWIEFAYKYL